MKTKLRWKKDSRETGLKSIGAGPRGSKYHDGVKQYASVSAIGGGWRPFEGWHWVAGWDSDIPYYNSCRNPLATEEEAKKAAEAYVALHRKV